MWRPILFSRPTKIADQSPTWPTFRPLVTAALARVGIDRIAADAGYDSEANHSFARQECSIRSIMPAKHGRPTTKPARGRYRRLMQTRFDLAAYRDRVQVETVISMVKRRLEAFVRGRTAWSQRRELRLKVLTHNVMILLRIQVFYTATPIPNATLTLKAGGSFSGSDLWVEGSEKGQACFFVIKKILDKRRRLLAKIFPPLTMYILAAVAFAISIVFLIAKIPHNNAVLIIALALSMAGNIGVFMRGGSLSSINLSRRHEASTFWSRNSDSLIAGMIGAALGSAVTSGVEITHHKSRS